MHQVLENGENSDSQSEEELSPMTAVGETCEEYRVKMKAAFEGVWQLQQQLITVAAHVKDMRFREQVKMIVLEIVQSLDNVQTATNETLGRLHVLVASEENQRRGLEKSIKVLAKQNYRMQKKARRI
eukprot:Polyplicarium_translucidae@DN3857_c0_g1_i1.p1